MIHSKHIAEGRFCDAYVSSGPVQVKDFVPEANENGFEVFDDIATRSSEYLQNQDNCDVISIQSFTLMRLKGERKLRWLLK